MPKYRFVSLERKVFPDDCFPDEVRIGESLDGSRGGLALTRPLGRPDGLSRNAVVKILSTSAENVESDEVLRSFSLPRAWHGLHQEYATLAELNGLGGHAPRAYAYGAVVWEDGPSEKALPAFVMEDMREKPSCPLDEVLQERGGGFAPSVAASFGAQLLDIILRQEKCGVTHADLSSRNVFVHVADGPGGSRIEGVYVIDYGQAKYSSAGVTPSFEGKRAVPRLATIGFGAPEIFPFPWAEYEGTDASAEELERCYGMRNQGTVDIWSLGALLFYLRTGKSPSVDVGWDDVVKSYRVGGKEVSRDCAHGRIVFEKRKGLSLPEGAYSDPLDRRLDQVIRLCTDPDPMRRWQSVTGIREMLLALCPSVSPNEETARMEAAAVGSASTPVPIDAQDIVAVICKLYCKGIPYSKSSADLVLFLRGEPDLEELVTIDGVEYGLRRVDEFVMSNRGWNIWQGVTNCPWRGVEFALFKDRVSPRNLAGWFAGCSRLRKILKINNLDTSKAISMRGLFYGCSSLGALSVYRFETSLVEDMSLMFYGCERLSELNVSRFDTSRVGDVAGMFGGCHSLKRIVGFPDAFHGNEKISLRGIGRDCPAVAGRQ